MNKHLVVLTLPALVLLAGCGQTTPAQPQIEPQTDPVTGVHIAPLSNQFELASDTTFTAQGVDVDQCNAAIKDHFAQKMDADGTAVVTGTDAVQVDYVGRFPDGEVFDTSIESIAKACGVYTEYRNYNEKFVFVPSEGGVIEGFAQGVMGAAVNETRVVDIPADQAYGPTVISYPKESFPPKTGDYQKGEVLQTMVGDIVIVDVTDTEISVQNPHPFAGKDLRFALTVKKIGTPEEMMTPAQQ